MTWSLEENSMEGFCSSRLKPSRHAVISRWISHIAYTGLCGRCSCAVLDRGFEESRSILSMPKWLGNSTVVLNHILSYGAIQMEIKCFRFYLHEEVGTLMNIRSTVLYVCNKHNLTAAYKRNNTIHISNYTIRLKHGTMSVKTRYCRYIHASYSVSLSNWKGNNNIQTFSCMIRSAHSWGKIETRSSVWPLAFKVHWA